MELNESLLAVSRLNIFVAREEQLSSLGDVVVYPSDTFAMFYKKDWLNDSILRQAIREIDGKEISDDEDVYLALRQRYLIEPRNLSTGFKNLALCQNLNYINRLCYMGDNCFKFLAMIASHKEVSMVMESYRPLDSPYFENTVFRLNGGEEQYNVTDFNLKLLDIADEEGVFD